MANEALEQIRQLDEQKSALVDEVRDEVLAQVASAIAVLRELGFEYTLVAADPRKDRRGNARSSRKPRADKDCPVCEFQTTPPHDRRHHKNQMVTAPFTEAELEAKGLVRIEKENVGQPNAEEVHDDEESR